jgi:hypothetical protein
VKQLTQGYQMTFEATRAKVNSQQASVSKQEYKTTKRL